MAEITRVKKVILNNTFDTARDVLELINFDDLGNDIDLYKVKVTDNDTSPARLANKLQAGDNIGLTVLTPSGNEEIEIKGLGKQLVSSDDTTFGYLDDKLTVDSTLTKTVHNSAGNEHIELSANITGHIGNHLGIVAELVGSAAIRNDVTEFDVESDEIKPISGTQKNIIFREDVSENGSLGIIKDIGSGNTMSSSDWTAINGLLFEYVVENGNWFNIKDGATATSGNYKPIYTGIDDDIYYLQRALFLYDSTIGKWVLLSFTKARWNKKYAIAGNPNEDIVIADILQTGFYAFDAAVSVRETLSGIAENTASAQTLTVKGTGGDSIAVDISPVFDSGGSTSTKLLNTHLQGSGIIEIKDVAGDKHLIVNVTLPNGDLQAILGGYIHVRYLGKFTDA